MNRRPFKEETRPQKTGGREQLPAAGTSPPRSCAAAAAAESALRPIRRLEEPAVVHATRMEEASELEDHQRECTEQIENVCLSHVIHLLSSPRT
jgi:hypothetical protein